MRHFKIIQGVGVLYILLGCGALALVFDSFALLRTVDGNIIGLNMALGSAQGSAETPISQFKGIAMGSDVSAAGGMASRSRIAGSHAWPTTRRQILAAGAVCP